MLGSLVNPLYRLDRKRIAFPVCVLRCNSLLSSIIHSQGSVAADRAAGHRVGGDLVSGVDGVAVGAEDVCGEDHRSPVHRAALLRPGRHRPPQPQRARQHDPPLHHLTKPPRRRHPSTSGRRPSQGGLTSDYPNASPQPTVLALMSGASRVNSRNPTL